MTLLKLMKLVSQTSKQSLNNAFLKQSVNRDEIDLLVYQLYDLKSDEIEIVKGNKV